MASGDEDGKGRHGRRHEKEGGIDEGWNGQHDGGIEGRTRKRITSMKGGTMMALCNTARGGTAAGGMTGTTTARGSMVRRQRQGMAWQ